MASYSDNVDNWSFLWTTFLPYFLAFIALLRVILPFIKLTL